MTTLTPEEKDQCVKLKAAYGLEHLHFYRYFAPSNLVGRYYNSSGQLHCTYIKDPYDFIYEDFNDLQFIMFSLNMGQCSVYFDDCREDCIGADHLKHRYLIFKLANI